MLRRLADFALAQVFYPHEAPQQAARVLLPVREGLPDACQPPAATWISVEALVTHLSRAAYAALYEVFEARLMHRLLGGARDWPTLWREALIVYVHATFGVDCTDTAQLQAMDEEASRARGEACRALYGAPDGGCDMAINAVAESPHSGVPAGLRASWSVGAVEKECAMAIVPRPPIAVRGNPSASRGRSRRLPKETDMPRSAPRRGPETTPWTIATVKATLPPVRIQVGTQRYTGTLAGRQLPSATVYVGETGYSFSWHAITRALNTGHALSVPASLGCRPADGAHPPSHAEGDDHV
jgi:hypothetical protein